MRQLAIIIILLVVGAAVGFGIGWLAAKPKINDARSQAEELRVQLQTLENQSQEKLRASADEIARLRAELMRTRNDLTKANTDLAKVRSELAQAKTVLEQTIAPSSASAAQTPSESTESTRPGAAAAASLAVPSSVSSQGSVATREYVIKEGDSFWKIAASQLGSGARYKEIIELNPHISPDKPLVIGTKIRIPAK